MSELEDLFEHMKHSSKNVFKKHGTCVPMFMTIEPPMIIPMPWRDLTEKRFLVSMIKALFKSRGVVRYGFAFEAWMATQPITDETIIDVAKIVPPSDRPDRTEGISVIAEEKGMKPLAGYWPITRDKRGRGILGEFQKMDGSEDIGMFRNMLGTEVLN
jgi:hypothetical protein